MMIRHGSVLGAVVAASFLAGSASATPARPAASTELQHCGDDTCLLIKGRRSDPAATVLIGRHEVPVEGGRRWRVALPLRTVQQWTAPFARSIAIEVVGEEGGSQRAALPIGVFGHTTQLTFLDVSTRR